MSEGRRSTISDVGLALRGRDGERIRSSRRRMSAGRQLEERDP